MLSIIRTGLFGLQLKDTVTLVILPSVFFYFQCTLALEESQKAIGEGDQGPLGGSSLCKLWLS